MSPRLMAFVLLLVTFAATGSAAAQGAPRPAGVTKAKIRSGGSIYHGVGNCAGCHGQKGEGTPDGTTLIKGQWRLGDGSYEWLVHITRHAGIGARGRSGDPAPMRGPTQLDSVQVDAVAAYVWSISRAMKPGPAPAP
jgi:mono/diheme cytochrome c family protein